MKNFTSIIGSFTCGFGVYMACFALIQYVYYNTDMDSDMAMFLLGISTVIAIQVTMKIIKVMFPKKVAKKASKKELA